MAWIDRPAQLPAETKSRRIIEYWQLLKIDYLLHA